MAKIFIPAVGEYREIEQIVAFGCSMTHGDELLDQERYPTKYNIEQFKQSIGVDNWYKFKRSNPIDPKIENFIYEKESQLSWPAALARLYNIDCFNYAQSGTGLENQILQFYKAKADGRITNKTLVVWGTTVKERGAWVQGDGISSYLLSEVTMEPDGGFSSDVTREFWYMRVCSPSMLVWKYILSLNNIFHISSEFLNNQLIIIQTLSTCFDYNLMPTSEREQFKNLHTVSIFKEMGTSTTKTYDKFKLFNNDSDKDSFFEWSQNKNQVLGGSHPTGEAHEEFAQIIFDALQAKAHGR